MALLSFDSYPPPVGCQCHSTADCEIRQTMGNEWQDERNIIKYTVVTSKRPECAAPDSVSGSIHREVGPATYLSTRPRPVIASIEYTWPDTILVHSPLPAMEDRRDPYSGDTTKQYGIYGPDLPSPRTNGALVRWHIAYTEVLGLTTTLEAHAQRRTRRPARLG